MKLTQQEVAAIIDEDRVEAKKIIGFSKGKQVENYGIEPKKYDKHYAEKMAKLARETKRRMIHRIEDIKNAEEIEKERIEGEQVADE